MFLRVNKNSKGYTYLQVLRSYRENGKVRQEVLFNFGRLEALQATGQIDALVRTLSKFALEQEVVDLRNDLSIEQVYFLGVAHVVSRLIERLGLKKMFAGLAAKHPKMRLPWEAIMTGMIMSRFIDPCSKRRLRLEQWGRIYPEILGKDVPSLEGFYRAMDIFWKHRDEVEGILFERFGERDLFNQELDVIFYDTTTLRFESVNAKREKLRRFGYSKEHRSDCTQVVLGLLIDGDGVPVGYELFPGNTYDSRSLPKILDKLKMKYRIRRIIFVADRGMITKDNLDELREAKMEFIVGMRLWNLPATEQQGVLEWRDYRALNQDKTAFIREMEYGPFDFCVGDLDGDLLKKTLINENILNNLALKKLGVTRNGDLESKLNAVTEKKMVKAFNDIVEGKTIEVDGKIYSGKREIRALLQKFYPQETRESLKRKGDRLILSWTQERAQRDAQVRNDILEKIRVQLQTNPKPKQFVTNKGYKQYLKGLDEGRPELDLEAINATEKRDGFFGVLTNVPEKNLSDVEVYSHYKELWRIEDAFGEIKGPLETRPMFHWTDSRIQSHVLICLLAYYVEAVITRDLRKEKADFTAGEWFRALNEIYAVPIVVRGIRAWVRNEIKGIAARGYELMHLKPPDRLLRLEKLNITQNVVTQN